MRWRPGREKGVGPNSRAHRVSYSLTYTKRYFRVGKQPQSDRKLQFLLLSAVGALSIPSREQTRPKCPGVVGAWRLMLEPRGQQGEIRGRILAADAPEAELPSAFRCTVKACRPLICTAGCDVGSGERLFYSLLLRRYVAAPWSLLID